MVTLKKWMDNLLIYDASDFMIRRGAEAFVEETPAFNAKEPAADFAEVLNAMRNYCHLKLLIFETHGAPGYVHFPKGGINAGNAHQFGTVSSILENDARVLFEGCSVGEGPTGRQFLFAVGSNLLRGKGGFVGATTSTNLGSPLEAFSIVDAVYMPVWGKLRLMQFDKQGSLVTEVQKGGL